MPHSLWSNFLCLRAVGVLLVFLLCRPAGGAPLPFEATPEQRKEALRFWKNYAQRHHRLFPSWKGLRQISEAGPVDLLDRRKKTELEILYQLSLTKRGRLFLPRFLKWKSTGRISVLPLSHPDGRRLKDEIEEATGRSALALYHASGRLFVDMSSPLLVLVPTFFHEAQHAIDDLTHPPSLKEGYRHLLFEHRAYRAEDNLAAEWLQKSPRVREKYRKEVRRQQGRQFPMKEREFRELASEAYLIPRSLVTHYFRRHRWEEFH